MGGGYREYYLAIMLEKELNKNTILLFGTGNTPTFEKLINNNDIFVTGCDISSDVVNNKKFFLGIEHFLLQKIYLRKFHLIVLLPLKCLNI